MNLRNVILWLSFFLSGASALIYQTAWQRMIAIFGGSDSITAALVVGAFLLGLGLGSLWASIFVDRCARRTAVFLFAACELGIGLSGMLSPAYFQDVLLGLLAPWAAGRIVVFGAAFAGMLLPTLLMGLSLPLLARGVVVDIETSAQRIGSLYAVNTLGAALGAFAAGLWAIGTFGFEAAIFGAAAINLAVGAAAAAAACFTAREPHQSTVPKDTTLLGAVPRRVWEWCALVFVSGFLIIALEIVWFRVVGVIAKGNVYTFPIVLGTFLAADAVGITIGIRWVRRIVSPVRFFIGLQTAVGLYSLLSMSALLAALGAWPLSDMLQGQGQLGSPLWKMLAVIGVTAVLVVPPALLLGMSFPIVQKAIQQDPALVGQRVGLIQLSNIVGNAAGSLVTGLVLLHYFGTSGTLRLIGGIALAVTLLLFFVKASAWSRTGALAAGLALFVFVILFPANGPFWKLVHQVPYSISTVHAEDRTGVALVRMDQQARLYVFGHSQSHLPFQPYHVLLGAVGPLVHPSAKSVLVIGSGLGATPYAAGLPPSVEEVRVVELVEPVYQVQEMLLAEGRNAGLQDLRLDPRYTWISGDGRRDLATGNRVYDVIESDAILPRTAGSGLLYSREFFELVRSKLAPGGLAVQWAPTPRTVSTFVSVFPHVLLLKPLNVLLGSEQPISFEPAILRARLEEPEIKARLAAAQLSPEDVAAWASSLGEQWGPTTPRTPMPVNTDLFPRDEYYLNNRGQ